MPRIVVVGSANTDLIVRVPRLPAPGETVLGRDLLRSLGGKGANQAVAAARLGVEVTFVARLGHDEMGNEAAAAYRAQGINLDYVVWDEQAASGVALILVDPSGENVIAVAPGANGRLSAGDVLVAEPALRAADCILVQLEIPLPAVQAAADLARRHGRTLIVNPAPAAPLPRDLLEQIDVLTPNEKEVRALLPQVPPEETLDSAAQTLAGLVRRAVVVTLGARGALICERGEVVSVPAFPTVPLDSTGAGDAFNGALAVALARGLALPQAVREANAAGACCVSRSGAQPALPTRAQLDAVLRTSPE